MQTRNISLAPTTFRFRPVPVAGRAVFDLKDRGYCSVPVLELCAFKTAAVNDMYNHPALGAMAVIDRAKLYLGTTLISRVDSMVSLLHEATSPDPAVQGSVVDVMEMSAMGEAIPLAAAADAGKSSQVIGLNTWNELTNDVTTSPRAIVPLEKLFSALRASRPGGA